MPTPPPPTKPILKRDGFTIKNGVITCNGQERVDSVRLEALFHPERLRLQRDQKKATDDAKLLFNRRFFAAQLRYYGIKFPKTATESQLKSLLEKAVAARQCVHVPASVTRIHQQLRDDYASELEIWEKTVENWDQVWKHRQEEEWERLETPSQHVVHNLDRFMEHYFLTNGQPDPTKKLEPVALYQITDEQLTTAIHEKVALVPGLVIAVSGQGPDSTMCIGWDTAAVYALVGEIENMAKEKQRKRVQDEWEKAMHSHRQFVQSVQLAATNHSTVNPSQSRPLTAAQGSFAVQCKAVMEKYPDHPNLANLAFNIVDSPANNGETLRAAVDFGVFQGTAILSCSQPVLDWFVRHYDKTAIIEAGLTPPSPASSAASGRKRKADGENDKQRPEKQQKYDQVLPPDRIFVQIRGRELIKGKICPEIQQGCLYFVDAACTKFNGIFDIPGVGNDIEVQGFKVSIDTVVEAPPWNWFWPIGK